MSSSTITGDFPNIFHQICKNQNILLLQQLIDNVWNVDKCSEAMQVFAACGWSQGIDVLLHQQVDVNCSNAFGWTPLMQAARNGRGSVLSQLLDAGASISQLNFFGLDALALAMASGDRETITTLLTKTNSSQICNAIVTACHLGDENSIQSILKKCVDKNFKLANSGLTPMMVAVCSGHLNIVKLLLSVNADPNITNSMHMTALDMAVVLGHSQMQSILAPVTNLRSLVSAHIPLPSKKSSIQVREYDSSFTQNENLLCFNEIPLYFVSPPCHRSSPLNHRFKQSPISQSSPCCPVLLQCHAMSPRQGESASPCFVYPSSPTSPFIPNYMFSPNHSHFNYPSSPLNPDKVTKSNKRLKKLWAVMKKKCKRNSNSDGLEQEKEEAREKPLESLLIANKLEQYIPIFNAQEIDIETFFHLTDKDLEEIGIMDEKTREEILKLKPSN